jgi:hypothetical protein
MSRTRIDSRIWIRVSSASAKMPVVSVVNRLLSIFTEDICSIKWVLKAKGDTDCLSDKRTRPRRRRCSANSSRANEIGVLSLVELSL